MMLCKVLLLLLFVCISIEKILGKEVISLTEESFDSNTKDGKWLVKFYAPWCHHCQKLAPILEKVANDHYGDKIHIGKVNVESESGLKSRFSIGGFPTLLYFENGKQVATYHGERDVEAFVMFGKRMESPRIRQFTSADELKNWLDTTSEERDIHRDPISMLIALPENMELTDSQVKVLDSVAFDLLAVNIFAAASSKILRETICKYKNHPCQDGLDTLTLFHYETYGPLIQYAGNIQNVEQIKQWIKDTSIPAFTEMGMSNYVALTTHPGKLIVLGAYNPEDPARSKSLKHKLIQLASRDKKLPDDVYDRIIFATIDGVFWIDYLNEFHIEIEDLPKVVIVDYPNKFFYENRTMEANLGDFITSAVRGEIPYHSNGWSAYPSKIYRSFWRHYPYSIIVVLSTLSVLGTLVWVIFFDNDDEATVDNANIAKKKD